MDPPPAYTNTDGGRSQAQVRPTISPCLEGTRHPIQGGSVSAKVASLSCPPRLRINLHQRNRYKSGDSVSGTIDLISEHISGQDIAVGSISISFSGRCTTTKPLRMSPTWRRTLQLFSKKEVIFTGPGKLHASNRSADAGTGPSFPFQFNFPSSCDLSGAEDFESGAFFNTSPGQPLPASFADDNYVDKAALVYELKAELLAPDFKGYYTEGSFCQTCILNVYAPRTVQEPTVNFTPHAKSLTHQSLDLLQPEERKYHERPLTFGQKLGIRSISTERQPKATFTATLLLPSVAIVGQPLPLMLHVDHNTEISTVAKPPIVHLIRMQVFIRMETSICSMKHRSLKAEPDQTGWTTSIRIAGKEFVEQLPRVEHLDLRKVMDLRIDPDIHPSFKTFNIARTHSIRATGTIKCAGKSFAIWSGMTRCAFLAKDYEPHLPGYDEPTPPEADAEDDRPAEEGPPLYANYVLQSQVSLSQSIANSREQRYRPRSRSPRHASGNGPMLQLAT